MARTRVWATEEAGYTDATLASSIDDKGTDLRKDVREVVNQLLGVAESTALADPVVATGGATLAALYPLATVQTYTLCIPWASFFWAYQILSAGAAALEQLFLSGNNDANIGMGADKGYLDVVSASGGSIAQTNLVEGVYGIVLPVGVTITGASFEFMRNAAAEQVTLTLSSNSATTVGASTTIATATSSGSTTATMQSVSLGAISATTAANTFYRLGVTITGSANNTQQRLYGARITYTSPNANIRL